MDSLGRSSWTVEEDAQLTALVQKHGVGNWHVVGKEFKSSRSTDSLRHRWTKLEKSAAAAVPGNTASENGDVVLKVEEGSSNSSNALDTTQDSTQSHGKSATGGGWSKGTPDSLGRMLWTAGEDSNLVELVKKHGVGNWDSIAEDFATDRTADGLRKRWYIRAVHSCPRATNHGL